MNPLLQQALMAIFRWALTLAAGILVSHGIWESGEAKEYVGGAAIALVTGLWILWTKYKDRVLLLIMGGMPQGSTVEAAKAVQASKTVENPPASLPDTVSTPRISQAAVDTAIAQK